MAFRGRRRGGKKSGHTNELPSRLRTPRYDEGEQFAVVTKLHGGAHLRALFEDGQERVCRITGKMHKKIWIREGDIIIARVWSVQPSKADVVWRYMANQKNNLKRRGLLDKLPV